MHFNHQCLRRVTEHAMVLTSSHQLSEVPSRVGLKGVLSLFGLTDCCLWMGPATRFLREQRVHSESSCTVRALFWRVPQGFDSSFC